MHNILPILRAQVFASKYCIYMLPTQIFKIIFCLFFENFIYICCAFWSYSLSSLLLQALPIAPHYVLLPTWHFFKSTLSPISAPHMCMGVRPTARAWAPTKDHISEENELSFLQQPSMRIAPKLEAGPMSSKLEFWLAWSPAGNQNSCEFLRADILLCPGDSV